MFRALLSFYRVCIRVKSFFLAKRLDNCKGTVLALLSVLKCVVACCSLLQCVAVRGTVLALLSAMQWQRFVGSLKSEVSFEIEPCFFGRTR